MVSLEGHPPSRRVRPDDGSSKRVNLISRRGHEVSISTFSSEKEKNTLSMWRVISRATFSAIVIESEFSSDIGEVREREFLPCLDRILEFEIKTFATLLYEFENFAKSIVRFNELRFATCYACHIYSHKEDNYSQ